jgi:predicted transposase YdaD
MDNKFHNKLILLAITLLDKQEGMPIEEWNMLRAVLEHEQTFDSREIMDNITTVQDRVFLNEEWVETNYHKFE